MVSPLGIGCDTDCNQHGFSHAVSLIRFDRVNVAGADGAGRHDKVASNSSTGHGREAAFAGMVNKRVNHLL